MPGLQARLLNAANRLFIRRRYGMGEYVPAKKARRIGQGASAERGGLCYPENIPEFAKAYLDKTTVAVDNRYASPVFGDFRESPPMLFHIGSTEILLDDSRRIH